MSRQPAARHHAANDRDPGHDRCGATREWTVVGELLGSVQPPRHLGIGSQDDLAGAGGEAQPRVGSHGFLAQAVEPGAHGIHLAASQIGQADRAQEIRDEVRIPGLDGVLDRFEDHALRGEPVTRPAAQHRYEVGVLGPQLALEHLGEEVVQPVPLAGSAERHDERVRTLQVLQQAAGAASLQDGVAQRAGEAVQHR